MSKKIEEKLDEGGASDAYMIPLYAHSEVKFTDPNMAVSGSTGRGKTCYINSVIEEEEPNDS